ncbi:NAD(P)H-binding protein [Novosphingobium flavum]|uniref:NAD(P)H-binding protein n=1 Tax=Novosphingobium flavum TaxID=1778672 RepID=A0A7X1FQK4_9SPHN|nr:NAD-dependent epimerase/dehydratase family protein [Novosphingobium flavum]MBC2665151.1 NAD(P)H-binding protein [Novosphingobium flavum]
MKGTLFLTGGSGFIGSALRARLAQGAWDLRCLSRQAPAADDGTAYVTGDLLSPETYRDALSGADVAVHLAASVGKVSPKEHWRVNLEGTRALIGACRQSGVSHILHVSTIAAGYPDQAFYPYAQSKAAAEALVRESGLAFTILRPTVVLGPRSPAWASLRRIARLPVIPLPQGARAVRIQPVDVDEVARAIAIVLDEWRFAGETLDVGGADPEMLGDFLRAVRRSTGGAAARLVRVPLAPTRLALAALEPVLRPVLPLTAGQLALFANDSTATPNWLMDRLRPHSPPLPDLLDRLAGPPLAEGPLPPAPADDPEDAAAECEVFARYLTGMPPEADTLRHYLAALQAHGLTATAPLSDFDRTSLRLARKGEWMARCIDAYCALFARRGALRRRLIILAAILENRAPTNALFEAPQARGVIGTGLALAATGATFSLALACGAASLGVARLARAGRA